MIDEVFKTLLAGGPLAAVLFLAVYTLWKANVTDRTRYDVEINALRQEFLALLRAQSERHGAQLESVRQEFLTTLKAEMDRHAVEEEKIRSEYVATLKKMTSALKEAS